MTEAARTVLSDCREALAAFEPGVQGARWRILYLANVALLRAVYPVLKERDVPADPSLRGAFKAWDDALLATRPQPLIYWEFVVAERNRVLKQYRPRASQSVEVPGVEFSLDLSTGQSSTHALGTVHHRYLIVDGPFAGQDQRSLIRQAIGWWETQLNALDLASKSAA